MLGCPSVLCTDSRGEVLRVLGPSRVLAQSSMLFSAFLRVRLWERLLRTLGEVSRLDLEALSRGSLVVFPHSGEVASAKGSERTGSAKDAFEERFSSSVEEFVCTDTLAALSRLLPCREEARMRLFWL